MISQGVTADLPRVPAEIETFYSNLSDTMHAAAQALTVLQLSHNAERIDSMGREELVGLASSSIEEIERLRIALGYLQQFIAIRRSTPKLASIDVCVVIADAIDGLQLLFREAGIHLDSRVPRVCGPVMINAGKVSQALNAVLLIAYEVAKQKDTVELTLTCAGETVGIEVRTVTAHTVPVNADMSLRLRIAEAIVRSQNGLFLWGSEPFFAKIGFLKTNESGTSLTKY
jgi:signal transduction histidine kinase